MYTKEWVEQTVSRLIRDAPENRLVGYGNQPIFDTPLIGIADGYDPLFKVLRDVVSPHHLLPLDILKRYASPDTDFTHVSVIVWILPFTSKIRRSNRSGSWPSRLYSVARNNGGALNHQLMLHLIEMLKKGGYSAVAPILTTEYDAFRSPEFIFASTWSERHIAHTAGLGRFGLNGCLITPLGVNVRIGSIVTNLALKATPRGNGSHAAPCLENGGEECGLCMSKCPVGAISADGYDKSKCYEMRKAVRNRFLEQYAKEEQMMPVEIVKSGKREYSHSLGCALCQCGVPCEGVDPYNEEWKVP